MATTSTNTQSLVTISQYHKNHIAMTLSAMLPTPLVRHSLTVTQPIINRAFSTRDHLFLGLCPQSTVSTFVYITCMLHKLLIAIYDYMFTYVIMLSTLSSLRIYNRASLESLQMTRNR